MISDILHSTLGRWLIEESVSGAVLPSAVKFHKVMQPAVVIQCASNQELDRHSLIGSRLRFTNAISYTLATPTGAAQPSIFNFSADGTQ
jgi:hypothetical protein